MSEIQNIEIDQANKRLYIYYKQDNSHLLSDPPPPSYYREVYKFESLVNIGADHAHVTRESEKIEWPDKVK